MDEFNTLYFTGSKCHFTPTGFQFHRMELTFRPVGLVFQARELTFHPLERRPLRATISSLTGPTMPLFPTSGRTRRLTGKIADTVFFMLSLQYISQRMKKLIELGILITALTITSCSGEDRSGERPLAPYGVSVITVETGDSCILKGHVEESHNSSLTKCGFYWGNDTIKYTETAEAGYDFMDTVTSEDVGRYYAVAYATNYIGTTTSDTVYFILTN